MASVKSNFDWKSLHLHTHTHTHTHTLHAPTHTHTHTHTHTQRQTGKMKRDTEQTMKLEWLYKVDSEYELNPRPDSSVG